MKSGASWQRLVTLSGDCVESDSDRSRSEEFLQGSGGCLVRKKSGRYIERPRLRILPPLMTDQRDEPAFHECLPSRARAIGFESDSHQSLPVVGSDWDNEAASRRQLLYQRRRNVRRSSGDQNSLVGAPFFPSEAPVAYAEPHISYP